MNIYVGRPDDDLLVILASSREEACEIARRHVPPRFHHKVVPDCWQEFPADGPPGLVFSQFISD